MTNTEITIKTFLTDGTESGEMTMPIDNVLTMSQFSFFLKLCRESDKKSGTQAIETIKSEIMARIAELKNHETGEYKSELCKKDGEKLEKKLLTVCPELKQSERKLKTIKKNQLYFWIGKDRENNVKISAHLGDKYQLPGGDYVFIEKEQPHGISEKPKYRATDATCGMMIKKGSLKEVKEFLKLESTETTLKNGLKSWRAKENAELIKKVKSGKIERNEIEIMTNDENDRILIEMYLTDIYTNAKQAEIAKTETTETTKNHLKESRKEESTPTEEPKGESTMITMSINSNINMSTRKTDGAKIKLNAGRKSPDNGLYTVPNGKTNDLQPVTMAKLQHDDGREDTIATTQNWETVCIMTAQTIDISGGIDTPETPETTAQAEPETVRFIVNMVYWGTYQIVKRAEMLTMLNIKTGKTIRRKIKEKNGAECVQVSAKWDVLSARAAAETYADAVKSNYGMYARIAPEEAKQAETRPFDGFARRRADDAEKNLKIYAKLLDALEHKGRAETVETTAETTTETAEIKKFVKGLKYSANGLKFDCTGTKPGFIRILVDGENKPRVMSGFVKDNAEYITYQHKTVTAFDIYADDTATDGGECPTGSPEPVTPETIPPQAENPTETSQTAETDKAEETELLELPETKSIKFFYNGMKINGDKKITVKCSYDMDADGQTVRIYADGYGAQIPRDVFDNVKNDTDSMTDYFCKDSCTVTPEHPLFKYIQYVAAKCELRGYKANRKETYEKFIAVNPGQPTAADLSAVAKYNADRATAAKAAAEEKERAEQEEHDKQISELCEFSDSIVKMACEKYPIRENAPTVRIEWSEHPAFPDGFTMSISAAQILFSIFDEKQAKDREKENHSGAWYYKTKFVIEFTDPETGEQSTYTGRQDLGDGEGGVLEHMLNHAEWERTHHHDGLHRYGAPVENPPETTDKLDFIKWLSQFLESSPDANDAGANRPEITMQTNAGSTADTADSAQQAITVTFAPELQQAAEDYAGITQTLNSIDAAVKDLPPEDIAHILGTLPHDITGVHLARRICTTYAKTDPQNAAMLLGAWILDFTNDNGAAQ